MKKCSICGKELELIRGTWCRDCYNEKQKVYSTNYRKRKTRELYDKK